MSHDPFALLTRLLDAPGPSGFERAPAAAWREAAAFADDLVSDVSGNSHATIFPGPEARSGPRVMFAGHIDEIGVMVVHIDDEGYCWFDVIGGWDTQVFVGQRVTLLGKDGPVPGVIGKQAIHLMDQAARDKLSKVHDLWIDIGATSKSQAMEQLAVGSAGVIGGTMQRFPNDRIVSRSLDNRIGAYVVLEALRLLADERPSVAVTAVATTQEEIARTGGGARTSATALEALAAVVVDVTHATDSPSIEKKRHGDVEARRWPGALARGGGESGCLRAARSGGRRARASRSSSRPRHATPAPTPTRSSPPTAGSPPGWFRCRCATCTRPTRWRRSATSPTRRSCWRRSHGA